MLRNLCLVSPGAACRPENKDTSKNLIYHVDIHETRNPFVLLSHSVVYSGVCVRLYRTLSLCTSLVCFTNRLDFSIYDHYTHACCNNSSSELMLVSLETHNFKYILLYLVFRITYLLVWNTGFILLEFADIPLGTGAMHTHNSYDIHLFTVTVALNF